MTAPGRRRERQDATAHDQAYRRDYSSGRTIAAAAPAGRPCSRAASSRRSGTDVSSNNINSERRAGRRRERSAPAGPDDCPRLERPRHHSCRTRSRPPPVGVPATAASRQQQAGADDRCARAGARVEHAGGSTASNPSHPAHDRASGVPRTSVRRPTSARQRAPQHVGAESLRRRRGRTPHARVLPRGPLQASSRASTYSARQRRGSASRARADHVCVPARRPGSGWSQRESAVGFAQTEARRRRTARGSGHASPAAAADRVGRHTVPFVGEAEQAGADRFPIDLASVDVSI